MFIGLDHADRIYKIYIALIWFMPHVLFNDDWLLSCK